MTDAEATAPRRRSFAPRDVSRATAADASRHSRAVRFLRIALPGAALAIVVAVGIYASANRGQPAQMTFTLNELAALDDDLEMTGIRLFGTDERNRPYTITAERLRQSGGADSGRARLETIVADLAADTGQVLHIEAGAGDYDDAARTLRLSGGVLLRDAAGYELRTEAAVADLESGVVRSEGPVAGKGPFGDFSGGRLEADRATGRIVLREGVRTVFAPPPKPQAGQAATEPAPGGAP